jgi:hypothetical protein
MQEPYASPIKQAEKIVGILSDADCGSAKIALRLADALIDQRSRYETAEALAQVRAEVETSAHK